ncbi:MAG: hypothetical protein V4551_04005 [Pseudomonadota bacterium]|jgi:hypothetical protein|nr:MAG: hypothetical protein B7Z04_14185 [Rhodobacterales bacterium 32-66-9]
MTRRSLALPVFLGLAACVQQTGPSEPYAFVGRWDCGVSVFTFTNTTYNNGDTTYPIQSVSRDGRNYTLRFANGYVIALAAVTDTGLTWVSGASGDQFNCRRL